MQCALKAAFEAFWMQRIRLVASSQHTGQQKNRRFHYTTFFTMTIHVVPVMLAIPCLLDH